MPINISPVDSLPNVPDSAKVMLQNIAQTIASDPDKFLQDLLRDAISFGLKVVAAFLV